MTSTLQYSDNPLNYIRKIFVEEGCQDMPYTREILARATMPVQVVSDRESPAAVFGDYAKDLSRGKQYLFLCRYRGRFLKPCPATKEYTCCNYQVLNVGMNCPMDCVYCILQAYLNNPWLSFYVNIDDLLKELSEAFAAEPGRYWRLGSGEFTDSLVLDRLTHLSRRLVDFMRHRNGVLELKTKTAEISNLQDLDHGGKTIMAWSLNSRSVMAREELRTASLKQRLDAAALCASWGYRLAFHFDPLIFYPGWQDEYLATVEALFDSVPREKIVWISMGGLRFLPHLRKIVGERFPGSSILQQEFITGLDGKFRYFRTRRIELYRFLYEQMQRRAAADTCMYLCMESDEVWREVFGYVPEEKGGLSFMLDRAAQGESRPAA